LAVLSDWKLCSFCFSYEPIDRDSCINQVWLCLAEMEFAIEQTKQADL